MVSLSGLVLASMLVGCGMKIPAGFKVSRGMSRGREGLKAGLAGLGPISMIVLSGRVPWALIPAAIVLFTATAIEIGPLIKDKIMRKRIDGAGGDNFEFGENLKRDADKSNNTNSPNTNNNTNNTNTNALNDNNSNFNSPFDGPIIQTPAPPVVVVNI